MTQDQHTQNYLALFQSASDRLRSIVQRLDWLTDAASIPDDLLKWLFIHNGMPYPSWSQAKRSLPARFEEFHAGRHTVYGFANYFSAVTGATGNVAVDVSQAQPRSLLYLDAIGMGLPNAEMLAHTGQIDECFYLYKDQPIVITVTVDNAQIAEFIRQTAKLEVPFGDDPNCQIVVDVQ